MRPLCCGMESHPYLFTLSLSQCRRSFILIIYQVCGFLSFIIIRKLPALFFQGFCHGLLSRGNAAYDFLDPSDSGKTSVWMKAVSRSISFRSTPTRMLSSLLICWPRPRTYIKRISVGRPWPSHPYGDSPPLRTRKECSEYRLCSIPAARKDLEVRGDLRRRQRQVPLVPAFEDAREKEP